VTGPGVLPSGVGDFGSDPGAGGGPTRFSLTTVSSIDEEVLTFFSPENCCFK
jgi:hypothetical protein